MKLFQKKQKVDQNYYQRRKKQEKWSRAKTKYGLMVVFLLIIPALVIGYHADALKTAQDELIESISDNSTINILIARREALRAESDELKKRSLSTIREITMYSSTPEQTDASPCIGANGQNVCVLWRKGQNICATNAYPINTILSIDKLGECIVIDRMNKRYKNRIDWYAGYDDECLDGVDKGDYCPNYHRAWNFGKQNLSVNKY